MEGRLGFDVDYLIAQKVNLFLVRKELILSKLKPYSLSRRIGLLERLREAMKRPGPKCQSRLKLSLISNWRRIHWPTQPLLPSSFAFLRLTFALSNSFSPSLLVQSDLGHELYAYRIQSVYR